MGLHRGVLQNQQDIVLPALSRAMQDLPCHTPIRCHAEMVLVLLENGVILHLPVMVSNVCEISSIISLFFF